MHNSSGLSWRTDPTRKSFRIDCTSLVYILEKTTVRARPHDVNPLYNIILIVEYIFSFSKVSMTHFRCFSFSVETWPFLPVTGAKTKSTQSIHSIAQGYSTGLRRYGHLHPRPQAASGYGSQLPLTIYSPAAVLCFIYNAQCFLLNIVYYS